MHYIQDLQFKKEIIPLFDFVCSEPSRDALTDLLTIFPATIAEALARQDILQSILRTPHLLHPFTYARSEFAEVMDYVDQLRNRDTAADAATMRFRLLFARRTRHRERGQLTLLYIFLNKIRLAWIVDAKEQQFPAALAGLFSDIRSLMGTLEVDKNQAIARARAFRTGEIVRSVALLNENIREGKMDLFWKSFHQLEAWISIARGIHRQRFCFPVFTDKAITISEFYHPLLKTPVTNSISIQDNVTLITGPNMSGKSTLLKSIGICVVLSCLGLAAPAESCELPWFDCISIAIDLHDDLRSGYSHFMQEVIILKNIVTAAISAKKCFAIFDELFRGTNVEDALAISSTTITGLTRFPQSFFFISTHLHQLKETLAGTQLAAHYIECMLEKGQPVFSYKLLSGWSDLRIGQLIFEKEGLNALLAAPRA